MPTGPLVSGSRDGLDWLMLLFLVAMWGTSFYFVEIALLTFTPVTLATCRIVLAAAILFGAMRVLRLPIPRRPKAWGFFFALALTGYCVPFFLIAWGQQRIDSGLAGIIVGFMPLATLLMAHRYVDGEHLTHAKLSGFVLGFAGLVVLLGPDALAQWQGRGTALLGQCACLGAAVCYAANSVVTKRMPATQAIVASAWTTTIAAAIMVCVALAVDRPWLLRPDVPGVAALLWLAIGPTAVATIVFFRLIARAGPTFMSTVNYLNPPVALVVGALFLGETIGPSALLALGLILGGIAVATRRHPRSRPSRQ